MDLAYQYLVGKLQEALAVDPRVNALDIRASIVHGRVHITGEVPTHERRLAVERVAREVLPDLEVRNEITVLELSGAREPEAVGG